MKNKAKGYIVLFLSFMILPSVFFYTLGGNAESIENKKISDTPKLNGLKINQFIRDTESFYNDRLPYKAEIVRLHKLMRLNTFNEVDDDKVIIGKNDWLFYKGENGNSLQDYMGIIPIAEEEIIQIVDNIERLAKECNSRGIKFTVVIGPNKEKVYSEYMPQKYGEAGNNGLSESLVAICKERGVNNLLYPKDVIKNFDLFPTYHKYDTHWNTIGGYLAAQEILKVNKLDTKELTTDMVTYTNENYPKDLANMLALSSIFSNDKSYSIDYKPEITFEMIDLQVLTSNALHYQTYESTNSANGNLYYYGDSFAKAMIPYLTKEFHISHYAHISDMQTVFKMPQQGDTLILETSARFSAGLNDSLCKLLENFNN